MNFLGYITLYVRVDSEESEPSYCKWESDFRKPITEKFFEDFLENVKNAMLKIGLVNPLCSFVEKEDYETSNTKVIVKYEWDER